jgi:BASS family bile acid:Na+ symporter
MPPEIVTFVNGMVVPLGLIAIMFSMGLSLRIADFAEVGRNPVAVGVGLFAQLVVMPPLALGAGWLMGLPDAMAAGLFLIAICPGGVTSNAITFAAKANVALAVVLTSLSSLITVFTIPMLARWGLQHLYGTGGAPALSIVSTMMQLAMMTVIPIGLGMILRKVAPAFAERAVPFLRPAALVVLIIVIGFSVIVSASLLLATVVQAGPAIWILNAAGMAIGLALAILVGLGPNDRLTIAIEAGVHNATMATVLTLSILKDLSLAITPTLYGVVMLVNAGLLVRVLRRRRAA